MLQYATAYRRSGEMLCNRSYSFRTRDPVRCQNAEKTGTFLLMVNFRQALLESNDGSCCKKGERQRNAAMKADEADTKKTGDMTNTRVRIPKKRNHG